MKQVTLLEVVAGDGHAIVAIGRTTMIAASAHALVLYVAGTGEGLWIRVGRHRPWRMEASMSEIVHEAYAWIEELDSKAKTAVGIATSLDPERLALS